MFELVKLLLRINYYYGRFLGVINFEINVGTGRASLSRKATISAAIINVVILSLVPLIISTRIWRIFWVHTNTLHEYVFLMVLCIRVGCVIVTILSRWWQRRRLVSLLCSFRRLVLAQPQVMRLWQRGVISKSISGLMTESTHLILVLNGLKGKLTTVQVLGVIMLYILISLLNVILSQYYFGLLTVHGHYLLINQELCSILSETHKLELEQRRGVCMLKSCALADRVDSLAKLQSELQTLVLRMTRIFGLQNLCICSICFISSISGFYYGYCAFKYNIFGSDWAKWSTMLLIVCILSYIVDMHITFSITYYVQDLHVKMMQLLAQYSTFAPGLDMRLEIAFEKLELQLIRNPLKVSVMGLYDMHRKIAVSMASSMISYSLFIIQYDIKNY